MDRFFKVIPEFISSQFEIELVSLLEQKLSKLDYEASHFDSVISNYRELTIRDSMLDKLTKKVKIISQLSNFQDPHVLDLAENGKIRPHFDLYCGDTIISLSLLSSSFLKYSREKQIHEFKIPRRSLYISSGPFRYDYKHEIINDSRRISIIYRTFP